MRPGQTSNLVRKNLMLFERDLSRLDELRDLGEHASDSEAARLALRYFEQFVADMLEECKLMEHRLDGTEVHITMQLLSDLLVTPSRLLRRNLIVHKQTVVRLEKLRQDSGLLSESEMVRFALMLYVILLKGTQAKSRFFVEHQDGNRTWVRLGKIV